MPYNCTKETLSFFLFFFLYFFVSVFVCFLFFVFFSLFFFFCRFFVCLFFCCFVLFLIGGSRNSYAITQHPRHIKMKQEKNDCADIILRVMIFTVFEQLTTSREWQEELCASLTPPLPPPPQPHPPPTTSYRPKAW